MDMNLQKYLSFVKTVEYGSFTRAAEILHYSQSGVSRMIGDLEKDWNMVLLERGKGGVRLTSNGLHMLPYAKELVADYEKMQMQVNALNGMQSGLIRIGTFSSIATHWLPNIIREFQKDYPHIEYELLLGSYTELEKWITEGRVDCSFVRLPTLGKFDTIFLEEDRLMAVLPENHPLAEKEKVTIQDICPYPLICYTKESGMRRIIDDLFVKAQIMPNILCQFEDVNSMAGLVAANQGIAIITDNPSIQNYKVTKLEFDTPYSKRMVYMAYVLNRYLPPAVEKFKEYIIQRTKEK